MQLRFPVCCFEKRNTSNCIELNHVFQYLGGFVRNYYLVINTIYVKQDREKKKKKNINNDRDDKKSPINLPHKSIHCFLGKFGADFIVTLFSNPYQNIPIFKQWNEHLENELLFLLVIFPAFVKIKNPPEISKSSHKPQILLLSPLIGFLSPVFS